ncbi:MAG: efflux RND transporter periplasmic adaptor subunit [Bryobacteraceae bacterium]|nr:efflux RND transporter periplasmic adaptor subunit [Bryobacteraceae bacterium]
MMRIAYPVLLASLIVSGCQKHKVADKPVTAVRTVMAEITTASNEVRYSGIVEPDTQVDLTFRVSGYVEFIGQSRDGREIQEGDFVAAGTVLARLRSTEYQTKVRYADAVRADAAASLSALKAQLSEAEAALDQASRDFERATTLYTEKAMTKADFDAVEARRNSAEARRNAAAAQIAAQEARVEGSAAQHREASVTLGDTALVAPFPGFVVSKRIARGSLVGAGAPAFVIADTRIAKVSFGVPDLALRSFKLGDTLTVKAEALPERAFRGRVSSIAPAADPTSRVFAVELAIPNDMQALKVGMVATVVAISAGDPSPLPSVPLAAIVKRPGTEGGHGVYALESRDGGEIVRLQPVALGPVRGNSVTITAGLHPGQRIVAAAGLQLADGERVKQMQ